MTTESSAREQAAIWLGCLLGISRGGATGFTDLYIENEWLGNPHSFVKISGGRSMTLFSCHFTRAVLRAQNWFRAEQFVKNNVPVNPFRKSFRNSKQETKTRPNIVRNVTHNCTSQVQLGKAVLCVEQDTKLTYYCAINNDGPRMAIWTFSAVT